MRWIFLLALLLAGCSKGAEADLQYIKQARSLGAEWALVNEQAARGQLNPTYVNTMHRQLREQLLAAATGLTQPRSSYGGEIQALLAEPDDASPEALHGHVRKLKQAEDALESA